MKIGHKKTLDQRAFFGVMAEAVRFELTEVLPSLVFKTSALNHSATLPEITEHLP